MTIYYMAGGETKVYHSTLDCPSFKSPWRYWHVHEATGVEAARVIRKRGLVPCRRCPRAA